jgi:ribosomal protein L37AE/L43A
MSDKIWICDQCGRPFDKDGRRKILRGGGLFGQTKAFCSEGCANAWDRSNS